MSISTASRPASGEYAPPFGKYIALVPEGDILSILESQLCDVRQLLDGISDQDSLAHHAPYTWSIRQVIGHVTDCERVFGYRALRIARDDSTPLAGFDENAWMQNMDFDRWPLVELLNEFEMVRRSHLALFLHHQPAAWTRRGVAIDHPATTRAFAYAIAGHTKHHLDIVRKRLGRL
jgi:hypothetical protein